MMKLIYILPLFLLISCGKSHTSTPATPDDRVTLYSTSDEKDVAHCDSATFWTHAAALGVHPEYVDMLEQTPGRIERYLTPCYPDQSASEASREMYIGWLHFIWSTRDSAALERIFLYGEAHGWIFGQGPKDLVDMSPLIPIMEVMRGRISLISLDDRLSASINSFRGHVLASYLWLWGRVTGEMGPLGLASLKTFVDNSPGDPMYQALYHRFTDGNYSSANNALSNTATFPEDRVPTSVGTFNWASCPDWEYYLMVNGIITGR